MTQEATMCTTGTDEGFRAAYETAMNAKIRAAGLSGTMNNRRTKDGAYARPDLERDYQSFKASMTKPTAKPALSAPPAPVGGDREKIARIIDPSAWSVSLHRGNLARAAAQQDALAKADAILALSSPPSGGEGLSSFQSPAAPSIPVEPTSGSSAPDAEGWIAFAGGERPVGFHARVDVRFRCGEAYLGRQAGEWVWEHSASGRGSHDIIAYRVASNASQAQSTGTEGEARSEPND